MNLPTADPIRPMSLADTDFALAQMEREGWSASLPIFQSILANDPAGCLVAEPGGECIGMITSTCYADSAWIGNLIVVPEHRKQGWGSFLMTSVLDHLREASVYTYRLDADPPGMKIYQRLGFVEEFTSLRFRREPWPFAGTSAAEPLEAPGIKEIAAFDLPRFGDNRERLLGLLLSEADQAWLTRVRGIVTGFAMVLPTNQGVHLGPWVANDVDTAGTLLDAALVRCASQIVTCGMPKTNPEGQRLLRSRGFSLTAPSIRMILGEPGHAGEANCVFGIANGATG